MAGGSGTNRPGTGWVGGDANSYPLMQKICFWWGSAPQVLLVQQPEWLIHGCKAMEYGAKGHALDPP